MIQIEHSFGGDRMDIFTGTEMFVIVGDLGNPLAWKPQPLQFPPQGYIPPSVTNTPSVKNGLANGYIKTSNVDPTIGVRFTF